MEIWKEIPSFNHYEASNLGRIRSKSFVVMRKNGRRYTHNGHVIKQVEVKDGYFAVSLYVANRRYLKRVNRLVYEAFNGSLGEGLVVDHINNNRRDNRIENLQAITNADNLKKDTWRHRKERLPVGVSRGHGRKNYVSIIYILGKEYYLGSFASINEASSAYEKANADYKNNGIIPSGLKRVRHSAKDGFKICSCCGRNISLDNYYISKGRIQGKCKECFKKDKSQRESKKL